MLTSWSSEDRLKSRQPFCDYSFAPVGSTAFTSILAKGVGYDSSSNWATDKAQSEIDAGTTTGQIINYDEGVGRLLEENASLGELPHAARQRHLNACYQPLRAATRY